MRDIVRFDWAIKRLLRNKANFDILEGLLSELLGDDIRIMGILESEGNKETAENKSNRVDVMSENSKGELIIIEVQTNLQYDYLARMVFGTSKLMVDNMTEGMPYSDIKKIISVNIVYFDLGYGQDYVYHGTTIFRGIHKNDVLTLTQREMNVFNCDTATKIYPEYYIIKVRQFDDVAKDTLDEWIKFLKGGGVREDTRAKGLKAAERKLSVMLLSREDQREYEQFINYARDRESEISSGYKEGEGKGLEKGLAIGEAKGIAIGEAKGIAIGEAKMEQYAEELAKERERKKAIEVAKNGIRIGLKIPDIVELTGLSEDDIGKLIS